ncbi:hypothetical protein NQ317_006532 [Molorchus minor]|uniref:RNA-directed DNA polymerase n=1 Tax=Molorchus minor TaxID=1323400 RepID=A0ABQ9J4P7_9CUCU|nr:hypothetical protein NQ317_006532 [Molorchus minor]
MDPAKLNKDELLYELHVRGFEEVRGETAASMRRKLGEVLANDAFGQLIVSETFQPVVLEEIKVVLNKIESLEGIVTAKPIAEGSDIVILVGTKLKHLTGRLQRLKIQDTEENKPTLRAVDNLLERLDKIEESVDRKIEESRCQVFAAINQPSTSDQLVDPNVAVTTPIVPHVVNNIYKSRCEPRKWGISFSGDGVSKQVEERRLASNIPEGDLLASVVDLLQGSALILYRSIRHDISSWEDFKCRFREEFQPFDYEDELKQEIRNRRQGPDESIGIYFACMKNLFSRLITKLEEKEKLTLLRRNLLPYFIHNLGLVEYTKVDELLGLCKKLEINKLTAERCHPTPSGNLLEPDLSQPAGTTDRRVRPLMKQDRNRLRVATVEETKCWNCSRSGHRFRDCRAPRHVFCFGCGADNVVKRNCSKCSRGRLGTDTAQNSLSNPENGLGNGSDDVTAGPRHSGATRCIVGNKGLQVLRDLGVKIDKSQAGSVTTANGASCDTIGSVNLPIRLEGKLKVFDCLVVPNIPKEIILGIDFWKEMELVPNFNTGGWNFPDVECCLIDKQSLSNRDHAELREVVEKYFSAMGTSLGHAKGVVQDARIYKHVIPQSAHLDENFAWKLVVPKAMRRTVLAENHDDPASGHLGTFKTIRRVGQHYYWPGVRSDVAKYVRGCAVCQSQKPEQRAPAGFMGVRKVSRPGEVYCSDLMGPFPMTTKRNRFLLVVADIFTKYTLLFPLKSADARAIQKHIENDVFLVYGVPDYFLCDNGRQYFDFADREATHRHMQEMTDVQESVRNRLRTAYQNNADRYNLRRRDVSFVVGDFVWRRNHVLSDAGNYFSAKLAPKFLKSRVVQKMSRNVYRLEDCRSGRVVGDYYVSDLKPFNE